jgi:hypothetical protein
MNVKCLSVQHSCPDPHCLSVIHNGIIGGGGEWYLQVRVSWGLGRGQILASGLSLCVTHLL